MSTRGTSYHLLEIWLPNDFLLIWTNAPSGSWRSSAYSGFTGLKCDWWEVKKSPMLFLEIYLRVCGVLLDSMGSDSLLWFLSAPCQSELTSQTHTQEGLFGPGSSRTKTPPPELKGTPTLPLAYPLSQKQPKEGSRPRHKVRAEPLRDKAGFPL